MELGAVFWRHYGQVALSRDSGVEQPEFESCSFMYFLDKLFNLPVLQFPHIKMEVIIVIPTAGLF